MRDRNASVENAGLENAGPKCKGGNAGESSMESCLQKRVSMLSYRRANVLEFFFTD